VRRVAWVTGAGRGIGRACALALSKEGFAVCASARTVDEIDAVARECRDAGVDAVAVPCDVTDRSAVERAHARAAEALGPPDVLVNAAGVGRSAPFLKTTTEFLDLHLRLNLHGTFHCAQVALPPMLARGWGRVVNVASVAGLEGGPYIAAYAASKHAVVGLTRSLAHELAGTGVTANAVCPGYVNTRMTDENLEVMMRATGRSRGELLERVLRGNPGGRLLEPEDVASVVLSCLGPGSDKTNGQALSVPPGGLA